MVVNGLCHWSIWAFMQAYFHVWRLVLAFSLKWYCTTASCCPLSIWCMKDIAKTGSSGALKLEFFSILWKKHGIHVCSNLWRCAWTSILWINKKDYYKNIHLLKFLERASVTSCLRQFRIAKFLLRSLNALFCNNEEAAGIFELSHFSILSSRKSRTNMILFCWMRHICILLWQ